MSDEPTTFLVAEGVLLVLGVLLDAVVVARLIGRGRWREFLRLPPGPRNALGSFDVLLAVAAVWLMPGFWFGVLQLVSSGPTALFAASQAASTATNQPTTTAASQPATTTDTTNQATPAENRRPADAHPEEGAASQDATAAADSATTGAEANPSSPNGPGACRQPPFDAQVASSQPSQRSEQADSAPKSVKLSALALGHASAALLLLILGAARFPGGLAGWGLNARRMAGRLGQAVGIYVGIWPLCFGALYLSVRLLEWADPTFQPPDHEYVLLLRSGDLSGWLLAVTFGTPLVLAPLTEELLFRGIIQPAVAKFWHSDWAAIAFTGIAFGLFHFSLGHTVVPLAILGVMLGFVYAKTGSLTLAVLLHAVFNGKTLLWVALESTFAAAS